MMNMREGRRTTAPAAPLMDYEAGRGDPRKLLLAAGLSALGIIVILPAGAALAIVTSEGAFSGSGWALLGHIVGYCLGLLGVVVAAVPTSDYILDSALHRKRQRDAFNLEMQLRKASGGVVTQEDYKEFFFYADRPNDMALIIMALTRRKAVEPQWRPTTGDLVDEGVWLGNRKLGDVNTNQARVILSTLAEQGFIVGRGDGASGDWIYTSVDEAISRYERKA